MRVKSILALACGASLSAVSCSEENLAPAVPDATTVITAAISEPDNNPESRSAIDPAIYQGGHIGILWTPDDKIGVYGTKSNACFHNTSETPVGLAKFEGDCESPVSAYYPYNAENDGQPTTALRGTLRAVQVYSTSSRKLEGDYKIGKPRNGSADEFTFIHLFSLFRIKVNATGTGIEGETLKSVSLEMPQQRTLCGDFTFNINSGVYTFTSNTSSTLKVKPEESVAMTDGTEVELYASCAPDFKTDDEIIIVVATDKHTATFTRRIAYDFEPNSVYTFDLNLNRYADVLTIEEIPEEETANCYMITTAGEHDFNASVIGNGQKGIIKGAGFHTEDANINPVSAKLLWEDTEGFITDVRLSDGRVYYKTTTNVGNAVIAVYDGPNATGKILWSWHIWGVGDNLPDTYSYATKDGVINEIMDRDLGAFPSTEEQRMQTTRVAADEEYVCHAMMYQWGRKDPMPNSLKRWVDGKEVDLTAFPVWKGASKEEHTIDASIQHPMELINRYEGNNDGDWLGTDVELLWGDAKFSGSDKSGRWTNVKTIYDPSPVGYRVPNYYTFVSFIPVNKTESSMSGVSSYHEENGVKIPALSENFSCVIDTVYQTPTIPRWVPKGMHMARIGFAAGSSSNADKIFGYGIYMKRFENDTEGVYYPATGYLFPNVKSNNRYNFAKSAYRWLSCGAVTNTTGKGCIYLGHFYYLTGSGNYKEPDKGLGGGNSGVHGSVKTQYSSYPWNAYPVRCVKDVK